jgi:hypothetical protein
MSIIASAVVELKEGPSIKIEGVFNVMLNLARNIDGPVSFNFYRGKDKITITVYPHETIKFCLDQFLTNQRWMPMDKEKK